MRARCAIGLGRTLAATAVAALALVGWSIPSVHADDGFTVAGEIDGLYPGIVTTLDATVTNPYPFAIRVSSVAVVVGDAGSGCPASMLEVGGSAGSVEVAGSGTGIVPLEVRMRGSAPDACQGATWPLLFTAIGIGPPTSDLPGTSLIDPEQIPDLVALGVALALIGGTAFVRQGRRRRPRTT